MAPPFFPSCIRLINRPTLLEQRRKEREEREREREGEKEGEREREGGMKKAKSPRGKSRGETKS